MIYIQNYLHPFQLAQLIEEVLASKKLLPNGIELRSSEILNQLVLGISELVHTELFLVRTYMFLLSETTATTLRMTDGEGWHNDGSTSEIPYPCYNAWIPLYSSSNHTELQVATRSDNAEIYKRVSEQPCRLEVFTKQRRPELFRDRREDAILFSPEQKRAVALSLANLNLRSIQNPAPGDLAVFEQSQLHRGLHDGGIRIQLSLKLAQTGSVSTPPSPVDEATLTKHGRLERQIVQELLSLQLSSLVTTGATLPLLNQASYTDGSESAPCRAFSEESK